MDIRRIRQEIADAKRKFEYLESCSNSQGNPYVRVALQTIKRIYILQILFPDTYPYSMPKVYVERPALRSNTYHMFQEGNICYQHASMWNPGRHDLSHVVARAAKWLNKYEIWLQTGKWPGKEIRH